MDGWVLAIIVVGLVLGIALSWRSPDTRRRRRPTPKSHRWVPGVGLGLTPHGPFPFITIYRRRR